MKIALVQCPAWNLLYPLALGCLKSHVEARGHQAPCFDFNLELYLEVEAAGGDISAWESEGYLYWKYDGKALTERPSRPCFLPDSPFHARPLPLEAWAKKVLATRPDAVGFSAGETSILVSLLMAREIRRQSPDTLLIFGGPSLSMDTEGSKFLATGIMDLAVHGEGEETLLAILDDLEKGRDPARQEGVGHLVNGEPVWNPRRKLISNLDDLPFADYSDFDASRYPFPVYVSLESSRGCVNRCAFCYENIFWQRFRKRSAQRVVAEIRHQMENIGERLGDRKDRWKWYFLFADSLINGDIRNLERICDLILEEGLDIHWSAQATVDPRMDGALTRKMKDSGCLCLSFGMESASQRLVDDMGKRFKVKDAPAVLKNAHEAGILVTVNIIVGFPTETWRDLLATILFLAKNRGAIHDVSNLSTLSVAHGSRLRTDPGRYGVRWLPNGEWTSPRTGGENNRRRRQRALHRAMGLLGITHQKIVAP